MANGITEEELSDLEGSDEYSLRHYGSEVQALIDSYRALIDLLDTAGVLQLQDDWAKGIQAFIGDVRGESQ